MAAVPAMRLIITGSALVAVAQQCSSNGDQLAHDRLNVSYNHDLKQLVHITKYACRRTLGGSSRKTSTYEEETDAQE
jgi:hypothetical protein